MCVWLNVGGDESSGPFAVSRDSALGGDQPRRRFMAMQQRHGSSSHPQSCPVWSHKELFSDLSLSDKATLRVLMAVVGRRGRSIRKGIGAAAAVLS